MYLLCPVVFTWCDYLLVCSAPLHQQRASALNTRVWTILTPPPDSCSTLIPLQLGQSQHHPPLVRQAYAYPNLSKLKGVVKQHPYLQLQAPVHLCLNLSPLHRPQLSSSMLLLLVVCLSSLRCSDLGALVSPNLCQLNRLLIRLIKFTRQQAVN